MTVSTTHPWLNLQKVDQKAWGQVAKELQKTPPYDKTFAKDFVPARNFMLGKISEINESTQELVKALNARSEEILPPIDFRENYQPLKNRAKVLTDSIPIANGITLGIRGSGLIPTGLFLWSLKMKSPYLSVVNGCAALALFAFSQALKKYTLGLQRSRDILAQLTLRNKDAFIQTVENNYQEIEKSSWACRFYLERRRKWLGEKKYQGLLLLKEDLLAIQEMRGWGIIFLSWMKCATPVSHESNDQKEIDIPRIQTFFAQLEKMLHEVRNVGVVGMIVGVGYLYIAYVKRTYLMVIAGLTFCLMSALVFKKAHFCEIGVAKIREMKEGNLLDVFNEHVAGGLIPKTENLQGLQKYFTIPMERIFRLIPLSEP